MDFFTCTKIRLMFLIETSLYICRKQRTRKFISENLDFNSRAVCESVQLVKAWDAKKAVRICESCWNDSKEHVLLNEWHELCFLVNDRHHFVA
ncbi:hypothetical protein AYJ08_07255 [Brevibacillus sp. SKDU10]|nr:hypothetical protein AYJ08_07255 [Brevibacillus sp. SKDU10]